MSFPGLFRSSLFWALAIANLLAACVVAWITWHTEKAAHPTFRMVPVGFAELPGWQTSDLGGALAAFRRSCGAIAKFPADRDMGGSGYAGPAAAWQAACKALPPDAAGSAGARAYFEARFTPLEIVTESEALFTGYYEPLLNGSWNENRRYRIPVYGRPDDLVTVDLGHFRHALAGERIAGRLSGTELVPYATRAEIDSAGLPNAPVLLYVDDPVTAFFTDIQGSGRVRFADGTVMRLAFAGTNGRRYTAIGRILIARGALDRENVSLQTIRAWLNAHPSAAQAVMEEDQSFVFFAIAPLGDPSLGSVGTEGVPLMADASIAVDPRVHPLGAPVYVATSIPGPTKSDRAFDRLLVAQDTGGAIRGAGRGDIFFGSDGEAEAVAGRMKSHGRIFVLVPKAVASALAPPKDFLDPPQ